MLCFIFLFVIDCSERRCEACRPLSGCLLSPTDNPRDWTIQKWIVIVTLFPALRFSGCEPVPSLDNGTRYVSGIRVRVKRTNRSFFRYFRRPQDGASTDTRPVSRASASARSSDPADLASSTPADAVGQPPPLQGHGTPERLLTRAAVHPERPQSAVISISCRCAAAGRPTRRPRGAPPTRARCRVASSCSRGA